jgi:hypothetical protein
MIRYLLHGILWGALTASLVWCIGCEVGSITKPSDIVFPTSNVSYTKQVQPFFDVTCNFAGCHNRSNPAANLSFSSYFDFMNRAGVVISGKAEQSLLIQVVDVSSPSARFHPASFQNNINQNHVNGLKTWIREGAKFN